MYLNASPLRYPGGKSYLTKHFTDLIKLNNISDKVYVEPFAGGAGVALSLLFLEYINSIWINDADYNIYCLWYSIIHDTEQFIYSINKTKVNMNSWKKFKKIINNSFDFTKLDVGFATFFLNRCNHSGVIDAGTTGGKAQKGTWKIDARFNKENLIKRIRKISDYKYRIKVTNFDALKLLKKINTENYFVYLDPPYYKKGKGLYLTYYKHQDHVCLSSYILDNLKIHWVLSYDNVPEIINLYKIKRHKTFNINYSVNRVKKGDEVIFYSDSLIIPEIL